MKILLCVLVLVAEMALCKKPRINDDSSKIFYGQRAGTKVTGAAFEDKMENNGEFPYIVSLNFNLWREDTGKTEKRHICGAFIIRNDVLLTAGHCLNPGGGLLPKENYTIVAGSLNNNLSRLDPFAQTTKIKSYHLHSNYVYDAHFGILKNLKNDIGIIFLDPPLKFNQYVRNISLAESNEYGSFINETARIMGWGLTENLTVSEHLMFADMTVMPCHNMSTIWDMFGRRNETLCLFDKSKKSVSGKGDSGGPAVINYDKSIDDQKIIGVSSYVIMNPSTLASKAWFGAAYVDVAYMRPWIDSWLAKYDSDPNSVL